MRRSTTGILISALSICVSGAVYAQAAGGGQVGTGISKPNTNGSSSTVSGASGASTMAPADSNSSKKMHKKSNAVTPASATNPGSGGS
ncbi:hypothetical protein bAD24_p01195 (plasmid) [Burkholderia sp. AD24]|nr:hypothetical protein bAD24_p01195 [Burkholderia sp. AD24]